MAGSRQRWEWAAQLGNALYIIAVIAWQVAVGPSSSVARPPAGLLALPVVGLAIALALRTSRTAAVGDSARRAWRRVAIACGFYAAGGLLYVLQQTVFHLPATPGYGDIFYLLFYPLMLWAGLGFPQKEGGRRSRIHLWLDALILIIAGALASWFLFISSGLPASGGGGSRLGVLVGIGYCAGDILLFLTMVVAFLGAWDGWLRWPVIVTALGLILLFIGDIGYGRLMWSQTYLPGRWPDALWLAAFFMIAHAAQVQRRDALAGRWRYMPEVVASGMPYVALFVAFLTLVLVAHLDGASLGLISAAAGITLLVMIRQFAVLRQNGKLLEASQALTEEMRRSEHRFRSLVQHSSDVIAILGEGGAIRYASPAVSRLLGYLPQELAGVTATHLVHPDDLETAMNVSMAGARASRVLVRMRHRDGSWRYTESTFNNLMADPGVGGIVINMRDVTERLELEERLVHQAYHDTLTNLANRALLRERLGQALQSRRPAAEVGPAILFLDLDGFKTVNDSLGHEAGDGLLVQVAERLREWLNEYGTVARLGGDEFAVLLEEVGRTEAALVAERALAALEAPFKVGGRELYVGASVGVALAGSDTDTADILLRNADAAMYRAKRTGKANVAFYEPDMHHEAFRRLELEADLRRALENEEFVVHYQPTVDLLSGEITGVEALVRWAHPRRGMVPPADFIPLAEETGLIIPLGRWVLRTACRDLRRWSQQAHGNRRLRLAVNLSVRQLSDPQLIDDVAQAVRENRLQPGALVLEVTESLLLEGQESIVRTFAQLKELGVRIAIDDFGTGYSSFGYLRRLPVDILKIDRSFVQALGGEPGDLALVQAMVEMARTLGFVTVAEGVERADQAAVLQQLHCHQGQGYYFARPTDADTVSSLLGHSRVGAAGSVAGG